MSLLIVERLQKKFSGLTATDDFSMTVPTGELHAVIGPNGAGKTTLINQLSGNLIPDSGRILFDGADITREAPEARAQAGIGRSYQITSVFPEFSVIENVMLAAAAIGPKRISPWRALMSDRAARDLSESQLQRVGLQDKINEPVVSLAHGSRRQLELAMTLAASPRLLLLDEPMAGMSPHETSAMTKLLASLKSEYTILLVEHDMDVVFSLADRITVLVYGRSIACGNVEEIQNSPAVKEAYLGEEEDGL